MDPLSYFNQEDYQILALAPSQSEPYKVLLGVALSVLHRMPPDVWMVCGPITTGGAGSVEKNIERFTRAINVLSLCGENIFTQMPFEEPMKRINGNNPPYPNGFKLLNDFFLPIFSSGRVVRLCFLPGWPSSTGTRWEHEQAQRLGLERSYFHNAFETLPPDVSLFIA